VSQLSVLKLGGFLIEPLSQVLFLLVLGMFLGWRRKARLSRLAILASGLWLCLSSSAYFADTLMAVLEEGFPPVAAHSLPRADAIVLLGGAIRGEVSADTLADMSGVGDRLVFAAAAYKAQRAPMVIVTGGAEDGFVPEANYIRDILVTMGVPASAIVLESRNRVTLDNGRYTGETLTTLGVESVLLVTSAFHMHRALLVFESLDVAVTPAPTDFQVLKGGHSIWHFLPSVKALQRTSWAMHEIAGYLYYLALKSPSN